MTTIIRKVERDYYSEQLEINKGDMHKSWGIIKTIIGKHKSAAKKVSYFIQNGEHIHNSVRIANEFNNYFVAV